MLTRLQAPFAHEVQGSWQHCPRNLSGRKESSYLIPGLTQECASPPPQERYCSGRLWPLNIWEDPNQPLQSWSWNRGKWEEGQVLQAPFQLTVAKKNSPWTLLLSSLCDVIGFDFFSSRGHIGFKSNDLNSFFYPDAFHLAAQSRFCTGWAHSSLNGIRILSLKFHRHFRVKKKFREINKQIQVTLL